MSYLHIDKMDEIKDFPNKSDQLAIMNRSMPENANLFFTELLKTCLLYTSDAADE